MHGVDHDRYPGQPSQHPPVQAGFGVVGVEHVEVLPTEDLPQLTGGPQVRQNVHAAGGGVERDVPDPGGFQFFDPRSGGADA